MARNLSDNEEKKTFYKLAPLGAFIYFISFITRIDLAAVFVAAEESGFAARSDAALALALTAICYGIGQFVSGWLGDRFDPRKVIACGLAMTALCNLTAGLTGGSALPAVWAVNGFSQAFFWPPIVRILSAGLEKKAYDRACVWVNFGGLAGTATVYLSAPAIIGWLGVRAVFFCAGCLAAATAAVWLTLSRTVSASPRAGSAERPRRVPAFTGGRKIYLFAFIMAAILFQGALRDGISNWMPTFISDNFGISSSSAVFSGAALPLCGALAYLAAHFLHRKLISSEPLCAAAIFAVCAAATAVLRFAAGNSTVLAAACLALASGAMHGVNLMLICVVPPLFAPEGRVALTSGIMNSGVYTGSALATYFFPLLNERFGGDGYLNICLAAAVAGTLFCLAASLGWRKPD